MINEGYIPIELLKSPFRRASDVSHYYVLYLYVRDCSGEINTISGKKPVFDVVEFFPSKIDIITTPRTSRGLEIYMYIGARTVLEFLKF